MAFRILDDKAVKPTASQLAEVLKSKMKLWDAVINHLDSEFGISTQEWKFYTKDSGWQLVVKHKKRTILYLAPGKGQIRAAFVLGDNALKETRKSALPADVIKAINSAKKYMEGTGFSVAVKKAADLKTI